ncbi:MAG: 30S ribosomal protein S5 [Proteobacteria bacterium]|jgi:small subunit ribosomal protein S5|nr:30S ribosomal protein S5 [Pseudomonadota bacterium]
MSEENTNEVESTESESTDKKGKGRRGPQKGGDKKAPRQQASQTDGPNVDLEERVVAVNRVAKVVKGGRRFSFAALIVVGDKNGKVGYGLGKAKEVPDAIRKAGQKAAKKMIQVPIENGTIPHEILGNFGAGKVLMKPAGEGTGIKAAGACRSILELAGVRNVLTKSLRGSNPHNIVKATFSALKGLRSVESIAAVRGVETKGLRSRAKAKAKA